MNCSNNLHEILSLFRQWIHNTLTYLMGFHSREQISTGRVSVHASVIRPPLIGRQIQWIHASSPGIIQDGWIVYGYI